MGAWGDALAKLRAMAAVRGNVPGAGPGFPRLANRDASGFLLFARSAAAYARDHGLPSASFDWYGFGLPALGWFKTGDKFIMSDDQQVADYPRAVELWVALDVLASAADAAHVPLDIGKIGSPAGSDATFRKLAADAWEVMLKQDAVAARIVHPNTPAPAAPAAPAVDDVDAAARKKKSDGSGAGVAALAFLAFLAFSDEKPRNRKRRY